MELNKAIAEHVTRAQAELAESETRHTAAVERAAQLRGRIAELEGERGSVIAARAEADDCAVPDDKLGHRLALIVADLEGLRPLLADAEREAESLEPQAQRERLEMAKQQWQKHKDQIAFDALKAKAVEIERALVDVVGEIHSVGQRLGQPHLFYNYHVGPDLDRLVRHSALPASHHG